MYVLGLRDRQRDWNRGTYIVDGCACIHGQMLTYIHVHTHTHTHTQRERDFFLSLCIYCFNVIIFQYSLQQLMETLGQSNPFFIRCIKSNTDKVRFYMQLQEVV